MTESRNIFILNILLCVAIIAVLAVEALWVFYPKFFPEAGTGVTGLGKQDGDQEITVYGYLPSNPKLIPPPPVENLEDLLPTE